MAPKIAIFDWGGEWIHSYYLAEELSSKGISVDMFLFIPFHKRAKFNLKWFFPGIVPENIRIIEIKGTSFEDKLMKLNRVTQFLFHPFPQIYLNLLLPYKTRKLFKSSDYKYIITVALYSLYWVYRTERAAIQKLLHYSLEIEKISDPHVKTHWKLVPLLKKELSLLKEVKGLIIQDELRLKALIEASAYPDLRVFFLPVSVPGSTIDEHSDYYHNKFKLQPVQKIVLYYGNVYSERRISELVGTFVKIKDPNLVLVLQAGDVSFPAAEGAANIKIAREKIPFQQLPSIISSATIGIALYDISWPNTRLTAFSSEKIARYLQAGVPFIAFANESYFKLKEEFDCCELIAEVAEIESAIYTILEKYDYYRQNSFRAFEKYYRIENTITPLTNFILS